MGHVGIKFVRKDGDYVDSSAGDWRPTLLVSDADAVLRRHFG